ncbi:NAD-dependent epimerase/dehydratase family protein [Murimonas intestini]|uniref:Nucleoside-diphosphate-sugar epimerase n=1 Tax=Murimonas intestini TaxID=1337051 RepID=A0AB73SZ10_9FIRM|nr:NAD(P)-dependent oxidoreductase [Murimonas intestini]MCR1842971.1 NAD(P)-dependent oxidoreductase [Murimonas intestini]MCR1864780.1 NAD(P)-dependent oxidoreductase [Murimonas intestini]MCR1885440.1 NAD(P)-dependent oxidoreductase [Murimonas intestini]
MRRAIVTGPTGAIGVALVQKLLAEDTEVYAVCRPCSTRLGNLPKDKRLHVISCDLSQLKNLKEQIPVACDTFYHLGWDGTTGKMRNDVYVQIRNVFYCVDAVEAAYDLGCTVFIGTGSQAEYGHCISRLSEATPESPDTGYGIAKLCAGKMSRLKCGEYGIKHIWTRILSVYGPYDGDGSLVMTAIKGFLEEEPPILTRCEQLWDYIYSKDAADILYQLARKGNDKKVYCVGNGKAVHLSEYVQEIKKASGARCVPVFGGIPYPSNQVMYLCADTSALEEDIGYSPQYTFCEGIQETIEWYKKEKGYEKD